MVAQPSRVFNWPSKRGTGTPELKSRPAFWPKYQIAASFCENNKLVKNRERIKRLKCRIKVGLGWCLAL